MFLTKNEQVIMEVLWSEDRALSRAEILSKSAKKWSPPSVSAFINNLLKKEAMKVSGFFKDAKTVGRTFEAAITKEEYLIAQMGENKPNLAKVVSAFMDEGGYDQAAIDELEELIKKKKLEWGNND